MCYMGKGKEGEVIAVFLGWHCVWNVTFCVIVFHKWKIMIRFAVL